MFKIIYLTSGDGYTDSRRLVMTITDVDTGDRVDIGATDLIFRISAADGTTLVEKTNADSNEIERAAPQSGLTKGVCYVTLEPVDTDDLAGRYLWELEGNDGTPSTLGRGTCYIRSDLIGVAS